MTSPLPRWMLHQLWYSFNFYSIHHFYFLYNKFISVFTMYKIKRTCCGKCLKFLQITWNKVFTNIFFTWYIETLTIYHDTDISFGDKWNFFCFLNQGPFSILIPYILREPSAIQMWNVKRAKKGKWFVEKYWSHNENSRPVVEWQTQQFVTFLILSE